MTGIETYFVQLCIFSKGTCFNGMVFPKSGRWYSVCMQSRPNGPVFLQENTCLFKEFFPQLVHQILSGLPNKAKNTSSRCEKLAYQNITKGESLINLPCDLSLVSKSPPKMPTSFPIHWPPSTTGKFTTSLSDGRHSSYVTNGFIGCQFEPPGCHS